ncbi:MAG: nucleotidyltransferase family protein [Eubacterium sp.]|nr:nucleotidyltransferase family protein [Candidatus Colimonas fimequi]
MKTLGIIAEYNPFHKGHKYHLDQSLDMTGADCAVAVMSGGFTQRGEISPWDKWTRSKYAVEAGVNLVVELPFVYACNQGISFAKGAVDILAAMDVDFISFGSEIGDMEMLITLVELLEERNEEINLVQQEIMKDGVSFAKSRTEAIAEVLSPQMAEILETPNNVLAMHYLRRINYHNHLRVQKAQQEGTPVKLIKPVTVQRHGSGYFETNIRSGFAGASEIRQMIYDGQLDFAAGYMPPKTKSMIGEGCPWMDDTLARMLTIVKTDALRRTPEDLKEIYCIGEGLENKIIKDALSAKTYDELIDSLTSKRYTGSAMRRVILYMIMNLKEEDLPQGVYARVLGADQKGRELIRALKKQEDGIDIITNVNKDIPSDQVNRDCLAIDMRAADIYNFVCNCDVNDWSDRKIKPYIK